jgi:hypothetical protein
MFSSVRVVQVGSFLEFHTMCLPETSVVNYLSAIRVFIMYIDNIKMRGTTVKMIFLLFHVDLTASRNELFVS